MGIGTLIILAAAALLVLIVYGRRSRAALAPTVTVSDIPRVLAAMRESAAVPNFAVFMFRTPDRPRLDDSLSAQFSTEAGRLGFDWVLVGPRNTEDEARFLEFARGAGYTPVARQMNEVSYWRIEQGDLARLCSDVITTMYQLPATQVLDLIVEGFEWRP